MNQEQLEVVIRALLEYEDVLVREQGTAKGLAVDNFGEELRVLHEALEIAYERLADYE